MTDLSEQPALRDQFAMAALVGFIAAEYPSRQEPNEAVARWATDSYFVAEAMLAERARLNERDRTKELSDA